jgi:hypothetical protein
MKNKKEFNVTARLGVVTCVTVNADSLEDALAQARAFKLEDFADLTGNYWNESVTIRGVDEL